MLKAKLILDGLEDFPLEKRVEAAAYIIPKTNDMAEKIIQKLRENPDVPTMLDIEQLVRGESLGVYSRTIRFDRQTKEALEKASMNKQRELTDLVKDIVKDWLRRNLYLARE